jgi:hypothetical protein
VDRVDLRLSPPANPEEGQNEPTCGMNELVNIQ